MWFCSSLLTNNTAARTAALVNLSRLYEKLSQNDAVSSIQAALGAAGATTAPNTTTDSTTATESRPAKEAINPKTIEKYHRDQAAERKTALPTLKLVWVCLHCKTYSDFNEVDRLVTELDGRINDALQQKNSLQKVQER